MKAILLANMGAPDSLPEMKVFLKRMFRDKAIINAPLPVRMFLSILISNVRYRSSWEKYKLIGGSPLQHSMDKMKDNLQKMLPEDHCVYCVYSYSQPFLKNQVKELVQQGISDFEIIPMYPQASYSTTGSLETDIQSLQKTFPTISIKLHDDYFDHPDFISYWKQLISEKIKTDHFSKPHLLFSAHAIPQSFVERGDLYADKIKETARLTATSLGLDYSVSFQSKIGKLKWTEPATVDEVVTLKNKGVDELILIPVSFINENLETKYDQDVEIIPFAREAGIGKVGRVTLPDTHELLEKMFYEFIISAK